MKKLLITIPVMVGALSLLSALLLQQPVVWAGGAGALVQPSTPIRHYFTDRLIVKLRNKQAAQARTMSANQVVSLSSAAGVPLTHLRAMSGDAQVMQLSQRMPLADVEAIARRLSADPQVEYAEPDRMMRPLLFPNDTQYANQWDLHSYVAQSPYPAIAGGANLPGAWDITTGSASVVVGVIDTGLVPHADIDSNILDGAGRVVPGYDFISPDAGGFFYTANDGNGRDNDPTDPGDWITAAEDAGTDATGGFFAGCGASNSSWHGTHVAGTIGAIGNNGAGVAGINWVSKILPVRVIGKCGGFLSDVADGVRWAAGLAVTGVPTNSNPAKVLNISLGGAGTCSITEQSAIDAVVAAGVVVVVAAGNSNADLAVSPESPANCNNVISVAAINRAGGRAYYSSYGTTIKIAAPGGDQSVAINDGILSTLNTGATSPVTSPGGDNYVYYQGTSMAAPHVTGIVALMFSANLSLTPAQVLSRLQSSARAFPVETGSDCTVSTCGAGIIDASAAVAAVAVGVLSPSPTSANFGVIDVGLTAPAQTITFTNTDNDSLTLSAANAISLAGANAADFSVTGGTCVNNLVLANGASCNVTLSFVPSAFGARSASLVVTSTATNSPVSVALSGTGTLPTVTVSATDAAAAEAGSDPGTFTITRTGVTTLPLTVNYIMGGSATNGTDYATVSGSVNIAVGSTTATVTITPIDDSVFEGNETVILTLSTSASYVIGSPSNATVIIAENDVEASRLVGGKKCFIATAAYGTPMAEQVRYLRAFRDQYLQTNSAGRWFVTQYYKYSPPFADYLRQHDDLRAVVRTALSPLVELSRAVVDDSALAAQTADRP
jgi:serine protease